MDVEAKVWKSWWLPMAEESVQMYRWILDFINFNWNQINLQNVDE